MLLYIISFHLLIPNCMQGPRLPLRSLYGQRLRPYMQLYWTEAFQRHFDSSAPSPLMTVLYIPLNIRCCFPFHRTTVIFMLTILNLQTSPYAAYALDFQLCPTFMLLRSSMQDSTSTCILSSFSRVNSGIDFLRFNFLFPIYDLNAVKKGRPISSARVTRER